MTTQNVQALITEFACTLLPLLDLRDHIKVCFLSQLTTVCTNIMTLEANLKMKRLISYNQKRDRLTNLLRVSDTSATYLTALK
jgi:hypothetical protein